MEDLKKYESILTNKLKSIINSEGLVESGSLLNSIKVIINDGEIIVKAEDYYKYLNKKHNLTNQLIESREMKDYIEAYIKSILTTTLTSK